MANAKNRLNIVILDACRDNPFARSFRSGTRGLAHMDAPSGTIIAYATAPGSVASDGPGSNGTFTQELVNNMTVPGLKIEDVFKSVRVGVMKVTNKKQTPWESSSLVGDFYFRYSDQQKSTEKVKYDQAILDTEKHRISEMLENLKREKVKLDALKKEINDNTVEVRIRNDSSYSVKTLSGEFKGIYIKPGDVTFSKRIPIGRYSFRVYSETSSGGHKKVTITRDIYPHTKYIVLINKTY